MNEIVWHWPQYVAATWLVFIVFTHIGLTVRRSNTPSSAVTMVLILLTIDVVSALVLHAGGFW